MSNLKPRIDVSVPIRIKIESVRVRLIRQWPFVAFDVAVTTQGPLGEESGGEIWLSPGDTLELTGRYSLN